MGNGTPPFCPFCFRLGTFSSGKLGLFASAGKQESPNPVYEVEAIVPQDVASSRGSKMAEKAVDLRSQVRGQRSEVRSQRSGVRGQRSGVRGQEIRG